MELILHPPVAPKPSWPCISACTAVAPFWRLVWSHAYLPAGELAVGRLELRHPANSPCWGCWVVSSYTTRVGSYIPGGVFHQHWGVYLSFRECIYGKRSQDSFFRLVYPHNDCLKGVLHHPERIHHLVKMVSTTSLREASQRLLLDLLLEPIISQTPQWRNLPQTRWS